MESRNNDKECLWGSAYSYCYGASWSLIEQQVKTYIMFQLPIIGFSVFYEWFRFSRFKEMKSLRILFSTGLYEILNDGIQVIASVFICISWATRAALQAVHIENWVVESFLAVPLILNYVFRFLRSGNKIYFVLQLHTLLDVLATTSHFAISWQTLSIKDDLNGTRIIRSWIDFGFVRSYVIFCIIKKPKMIFSSSLFSSQVLLLIFRCICLSYFAATSFLFLESLGDLEHVNSFFFQVYQCPSLDGTTSPLSSTRLNANCTEQYSYFSSIYYMFVTVSTVGYGDFSPQTLIGRLCSCFIIVVGIYKFAQETAKLMSIYEDHRKGREAYRPGKNRKHVILIGNPSLIQLESFFREFFHHDHETLWSSDIPNIVVLLDEDLNLQQQVNELIYKRKRLHKRVFILSGNSLDPKDLARAGLQDAQAVFILPDQYSSDVEQEDSANLLRILTVRKYSNEYTQLFAMISNSQNIQFTCAFGVKQRHLVCLDELKLGLMGLSCRCQGLSTLVSNLVTSRSASPPPEGFSRRWMHEYITGAASEIYSCVLHKRYHGLTFIQAAQVIQRATGGQVLLIGIVRQFSDEIEFNPGSECIISHQLEVYCIAESANILQCCKSTSHAKFANGMGLFMLKGIANLLHRSHRVQHRVERRVPQEVRDWIELHKTLHPPSEPPFAVLSQPHIVVCCNFTSSSPYSLARLKNFLIPLRTSHIDPPEAVVIIDPQGFQESWWSELAVFPHVFHVQGSPLSHSVLERAGIENASKIVVLAQSSEVGYDDSKAIFNAILIESAILDTNKVVIIELTDLHNNKYLDPVKETSCSGNFQQDSNTSSFHQNFNNSSQNYEHYTFKSKMNSSTSKIKNAFNSIKQFLRSIDSVSDGGDLLDEANDVIQHIEEESFLMQRFVCGNLFPSTIAGDLLIQSFFNLPISHFVAAVLHGKDCVVLYSVPPRFCHGDTTYGKLFGYFTSRTASLLPIALLRVPTEENIATRPYVYTCPYNGTLVHPDDKVFVVINRNTLHFNATKIQRFCKQKLLPSAKRYDFI